jgi:hypothetical protein
VIDPSSFYVGQVDTSDPIGYPHGAAQNVTSAGDGTGFPLEKAWINDVLGFFQAILAAVGVAPSGVSEKVGASQLFSAIASLGPDVQQFTANGTWTKPSFALWCEVVLVSHGYNGGAGNPSSGDGAGGGGSSGSMYVWRGPASMLPATLAITVGTVGQGTPTTAINGATSMTSGVLGSSGASGASTSAGGGITFATGNAGTPGSNGVPGNIGGPAPGTYSVCGGGGGAHTASGTCSPGGSGGGGFGVGGAAGLAGNAAPTGALTGGRGGTGYGAGGGGGAGAGTPGSDCDGGGGGGAGYGFAALAGNGGDISLSGQPGGAGAPGIAVITTHRHF